MDKPLFDAVGNAILLLLIGLLYCVWKLLEDFASPMLWALLVSLALRDVKVALVRFWTKKLERHTLLGLGLAPLGVFWRAMKSAMRRVNALMGLTPPGEGAGAGAGMGGGGGGGNPGVSDDEKDDGGDGAGAGFRGGAVSPGVFRVAPVSPTRTPRNLLKTRFQPSSAYDTAAAAAPSSSASLSSSSASTFHFRWLVTVGLALEGWSLLSRDWVLTRSIVALAAVAALGAAATVALVALTNWYLFTREGAYAGGARGEQKLVRTAKRERARQSQARPGRLGPRRGKLGW